MSETPPGPEGPQSAQPDSKDLEELREVLEGEVTDDSASAPSLRAVRAVRTFFHSGPLPASEWFRQMEEIEPGTTKAIVDDYLAEREHQRQLQHDALDLDRTAFQAFSRYQKWQLAAAWTLAAIFGAAGIVLIATGHSITGLIWLVIEIATLAAAFLGREIASRRGPSEEPPALPDRSGDD